MQGKWREEIMMQLNHGKEQRGNGWNSKEFIPYWMSLGLFGNSIWRIVAFNWCYGCQLQLTIVSAEKIMLCILKCGVYITMIIITIGSLALSLWIKCLQNERDVSVSRSSCLKTWFHDSASLTMLQSDIQIPNLSMMGHCCLG
jgi:hypothetical protein